MHQRFYVTQIRQQFNLPHNTGVRKFLANIKQNLNLQTPEDWNTLTRKQVQIQGGGLFLNTYPLHELKSMGSSKEKSIFNYSHKHPSGHWEKKENVQNFLCTLQDNLQLQSKEDWDLLTRKQIVKYGGSSLLNKYSLYNLKCIGFPEGKFYFKKQKNKIGHWKNIDNVKQLLETVKIKYNLSTFDDWNSLTRKQIQNLHASSLLNHYSIYDLKCMGYPEGKLKFTKKKSKTKELVKPKGYWNNSINTLQFLSDFKKTFNLNTPQDWDLITVKQIELAGGSKLITIYSLFEIKCLGCPEGKSFFEIKMRKHPGFWDNKENIQNYLQQLRENFKLETPKDWNSLSTKLILDNGGGKLFDSYSLYEIKCLGCPEGKLLFDKSKKSLEYWENERNIIKFIDELRLQFNIQSMEDWKRLSKAQIKAHGGTGLLHVISNNSTNFLSEIKDQNTKEIISVIMSDKTILKSNQRWLFLQLQKLFPGEEMVEDYFHTEISRKTGFPVQFDIFLVQKKIAFEYNGKQHYEDIPSSFAPLELLKERDSEKEKLCNQFGIKLIVIPYWWDNNLVSLKKTVQEKIALFENKL